MELRIEQLAENLTRVTPIGRWDIKGASEIEARLSVVAGSGRHIIIDLTQVSYLSSMGMRSLVMSAKSAGLKGSRLVLLSPAGNVAEVLTAAGIDQFIPIYDDLDGAVQAVTG